MKRQFGMMTERAHASFLEPPRLLKDRGIGFSVAALSWEQIWLEAFTWESDAINLLARINDDNVSV